MVAISEVSAQEGSVAAAGQPAWRIVPKISVDGIWTDNVNPGQATKTGDFITHLAPGVQLDAKGARISGSASLSLNQYIYAKDNGRNNLQTAMSGKGLAEVVDQWLFLEAQGNIGQQSVSAFGTPVSSGTGNELINTNRTEVRSFEIAPRIQGHFGAFADYQLRFSRAESRSDAGALTGNGSAVNSWNGRIAGSTPLSFLGWSVLMNRQDTSRGSTGNTSMRRLSGELEFRIDPQVKTFLRAGNESDNYTTLSRNSRSTYGAGVAWAPTERTQVRAQGDKRSFGNGYSLEVSHRTALTAWKFVDSRDVQVPAAQLSKVSSATALELQTQQLTSAFPDPVQREQEARALLAAAGISPDQALLGNILSTRPYLQRRQEASVSITGALNTVTFTAQRQMNEQLSSVTAVADDFAISPRIRQSGFSVNWAHKLTPDSSVTVSSQRNKTAGETAALESRLQNWSVLLTTRLAQKTSASLGFRQTSTDRAAGNNFDEQAVTGSLLVSF
jgi:uncharacterized protein (PEP-CTERM system associated)